MNHHRFTPHLFAALSLALPALLYMGHFRYMGFPDGHLTELDRAEKLLFQVFLWFSMACGIQLLTLSISPAWQENGKMLRVSIIVYGVMVLVARLVRCFLGLHLDNGRGG